MTRSYIGSELELFAAATNWKAYFSSALAPFIGARVLEIGAGIGNNIPFLHTPAVRQWTSVEPDPDLARRIAERITLGELPESCRVLVGTIESIDETSRFNTVFYIDVLEHIADDAAELNYAAGHLAPDGNLVVLAPAHQFLFSEFDAAIGHHRRYDAVSLTAVTPPAAGCEPVLCSIPLVFSRRSPTVSCSPRGCRHPGRSPFGTRFSYLFPAYWTMSPAINSARALLPYGRRYNPASLRQ